MTRVQYDIQQCLPAGVICFESSLVRDRKEPRGVVIIAVGTSAFITAGIFPHSDSPSLEMITRI